LQAKLDHRTDNFDVDFTKDSDIDNKDYPF